MLGVRPGELVPVLKVWRRHNPEKDWTWLVKRALRAELRPYAGKRYAHLVEPKNGEVAA